ncbi:MAG: DUF1801 domain-containing protein [Bacteroidota bacterium]|nr:DUF1801 domain-containing protein [Bacteroidota bacterium]
MEIKIKFKTVDEYLSALPPKVKAMMKELRDTIKQAAPEAEEIISYNMPAFKFYGVLVYFAAHKNHIGFYPGSKSVIEAFKNELTGFETSKGTVRFSFDKKLPVNLISDIVKFRVNQNLAKAALKKQKK